MEIVKSILIHNYRISDHRDLLFDLLDMLTNGSLFANLIGLDGTRVTKSIHEHLLLPLLLARVLVALQTLFIKTSPSKWNGRGSSHRIWPLSRVDICWLWFEYSERIGVVLGNRPYGNMRKFIWPTIFLILILYAYLFLHIPVCLIC